MDPTWENPSEEQTAALELTMKVGPARGLTEFELADMMCLAPDMLWYVQAKRWAKEPPKLGGPEKVWQAACKAIVEIVGLGYDKDKGWWPMKELKNPLAATILLMDFGVMLKQYRQQSNDTVSWGFEAFLDIVCGPGWEKRYKKYIKDLRRKTGG